MEDSPGSPLTPQGGRPDEAPREPAAAAAEPSVDPDGGSDPDDDNGWLPV